MFASADDKHYLVLGFCMHYACKICNGYFLFDGLATWTLYSAKKSATERDPSMNLIVNTVLMMGNMIIYSLDFTKVCLIGPKRSVSTDRQSSIFIGIPVAVLRVSNG